MLMKPSKEYLELRKYLKNLGKSFNQINGIYMGDLYNNKNLLFKGILIETSEAPSSELEEEIKKLNDLRIKTRRV